MSNKKEKDELRQKRIIRIVCFTLAILTVASCASVLIYMLANLH